MARWHGMAAWFLAVLASGCGSPAPPEHGPIMGRMAVEDWRVEPRVRIGALNRYGSALDIAKAYGSLNLRDSSVTIGEGVAKDGTIVYPEDPQRRFEIVWADPGARRAPHRVILRGERTRWMLPKDVSLGTSLRELEEKNGRPFRLAGFGWDYAGVVTSWAGGALDSALGTGIKVYLEPRIEDRTGPGYKRLQGDREFLSSDPSMEALNPRIYQIFVDFDG